MARKSNKGNEAWQKLRKKNEKLYLKCPLSFSRNIENILSGSDFNVFPFLYYNELIESLRRSPENNRGNIVIYHFTETFGSRGEHETKRIVTDIKHYIPRSTIIGLYRNNPLASQLLIPNGVSDALEYSTNPRSNFATSLRNLLF